MAFWGIELESGKSFTHRFDEGKGRLHVSQATLGTGSSKKKSIVQCSVGGQKPIYLCSLLPEKVETCQLSLEFEEEDEVTFTVIGSHSVHLSGFFYGEDVDDHGDNCRHHEHFEEDSVETSSDSYDEDEDEDDFSDDDEDEDDLSDDDIDMFPTSPIPNTGVRIEEILDDDKHANESSMSKRSKKKKSQVTGSDDNKNSEQKNVVKNSTEVPVLESEDEDGFPICSPAKGKANLSTKEQVQEAKDKKTSEEAKNKNAKDSMDRIKSVKRKIDGIVLDEDQSRETGQPVDSSVLATSVVPEKSVKQTKKSKKKKVKGKEEDINKAGIGSKTEAAISMDVDQGPAVENGNKEKIITEVVTDNVGDSVADEKNSKEGKKKKKKKSKQEGAAGSSIKQNDADKGEKAEAKPSQVRSFANGLVIEELGMGKPDGKRASPGKKVSVQYTGKLKKNGKIFDSNVGRAPFKFRLGIGEVIAGWDVGVNGMRVGDTRRLTIPPAMGYGVQGAGGAIPPNSWLVFDVELKDVN